MVFILRVTGILNFRENVTCHSAAMLYPRFHILYSNKSWSNKINCIIINTCTSVLFWFVIELLLLAIVCSSKLF